MLFDENNKPVTIGSPLALAAQAEEILKADLGYALSGADIKASKTGKEIKEALKKKVTQYEEQMTEVMSKIATKEASFKELGIKMPPKKVHPEEWGIEYESIWTANSDGNNTSELAHTTTASDKDKHACMREWVDLQYQKSGIKKDIKDANAMCEMISDTKKYPLRLREYKILFA